MHLSLKFQKSMFVSHISLFSVDYCTVMIFSFLLHSISSNSYVPGRLIKTLVKGGGAFGRWAPNRKGVLI